MSDESKQKMNENGNKIVRGISLKRWLTFSIVLLVIAIVSSPILSGLIGVLIGAICGASKEGVLSYIPAGIVTTVLLICCNIFAICYLCDKRNQLKK